MKKTIRLTESDLHRIIIEAINELDWKTYANAARANDKKYFNSTDYMNNKKGYKRSEEFSAAAKQAFDDKYGVKHTSSEDSKEYEYGFDPNYVSRIPGSIYKVTSHIPDSDAKEVSDLEYDGEYYDDGYFSPFYNNNNLHKERPEYFDKYVPWAVDRMKSGDDDISKFANGDYEYQKGKGWIANKSVSKIDSIVKESVRRILKESYPYNEPEYENDYDDSLLQDCKEGNSIHMYFNPGNSTLSYTCGKGDSCITIKVYPIVTWGTCEGSMRDSYGAPIGEIGPVYDGIEWEFEGEGADGYSETIDNIINDNEEDIYDKMNECGKYCLERA